MSWIYLLFAGIFEIGWIYSLKLTNGFTKFIPLIFYAIFGLCSTFFLSRAVRNIDLGTAYSEWMGISVIGITIAGIIFLKEDYSVSKMIFFYCCWNYRIEIFIGG